MSPPSLSSVQHRARAAPAVAMGSCCCYGHIPSVCTAQVATSGRELRSPSYNALCARDLTASHGYTHPTQLNVRVCAFRSQYFQAIQHICHLLGKNTHKCFPTHSCGYHRRSVTHGSCSDSKPVKNPYKKSRKLPGKLECSNICLGLTEFCGSGHCYSQV